MNLSDTVLTELLVAGSITIRYEEMSAVHSLRVGLYRKLQAHIEQWDAIGYLRDDLRDTTISVELQAETQTARISLVKRKPKLRFQIISVGNGLTNGTPVPADLEHHQESKIQHGSSSPDSQDNGKDSDSGCPQGESSGECSAEEDWQSVLRRFVEQDSGGREEQ